MKKEKYCPVILDVLYFESSDIVTASNVENSNGFDGEVDELW